MNWLRIALILTTIFVLIPVAIGKFLRWSDGTPPLRLHRRPNIKVVPRDEKDAAA